jgi:hypothetical protein
MSPNKSTNLNHGHCGKRAHGAIAILKVQG